MIQRTHFSICAVVLVAALGACSKSSGTRSETPMAERTTTTATAPTTMSAGTASSGGMDAASCPMGVMGTTVSAMDTDGGVALVFVTPNGDVVELRRRVRHMADMHNSPGTTGSSDSSMSGSAGTGSTMGGTGMGHQGMSMVDSVYSVEDTENGVRLIIMPRDPSQLGTLREQVHANADRLARGDCAMM